MGSQNKLFSPSLNMDKKPFDTISILLQLDSSYKRFLDSPTDKNLEDFLKLSALYKESWIKDASSDEISDCVSSKDLDSESELQQAFKDAGLDGAELKQRFTLGQTGLDVENSKDIKKYFAKNRINTFTSKSGLVKLISSSIYIPPINQLGGDDLHFIQHDMRGFKFDDSLKRSINRRWYVSSETQKNGEDTEPQVPWSIHRNDYDGLIDLANEGEGFVNFLNDERIDDYSVLFSNDLPEKAAEELFNEITIEEEREYLRKNDYRFIVFEADYFKYPTQYYNYQAGGRPIWRDVCIFNHEEITFRSLTTDLNFSPSIQIFGNPKWVLSNDMPSISNQAIRCFMKYTHPKLKIKQEPTSSDSNTSKIYRSMKKKDSSKKEKNKSLSEGEN